MNMRRNAAILLASLALSAALTGCTQPVQPTAGATAAPTPIPTAAAPAPTAAPAPALNEPPLDNFVREQPLPDFLTGEQQQLFLHAFQAAQFLMGCSTSNVECDYALEEPIDWNGYETVEMGDYIYTISQGYFRQWEDFQAMLDSLFTPEYQEELLNSPLGDGSTLPLFISTGDGRLCFLEADRGSDLEYGWSDTPDSYELVSQSEEEIVFHLIGHYADLETSELDADGIPHPTGEYTTAYPIRMVNTGGGWRFSEFHLPY